MEGVLGQRSMNLVKDNIVLFSREKGIETGGKYLSLPAAILSSILEK